MPREPDFRAYRDAARAPEDAREAAKQGLIEALDGSHGQKSIGAGNMSAGPAMTSGARSLSATLAWMQRVLITGMSGTGKSTVLAALDERGHKTVDTDSDRWSHWITLSDGSADWVWREDAIAELLNGHERGKLFVAGCTSNQPKFYLLFDHVVLLSAPAEVLLGRIAVRRTNNYGKAPAERDRILHDLARVEPLLRKSATIEIDASGPLEVVVRKIDQLSPDGRAGRRG